MNAAQAYYEIFKALPKKTRKEVLNLIENEKEETVSISLRHLEEGLKEIKKLKAGKARTISFEEMMHELKS